MGVIFVDQSTRIRATRGNYGKMSAMATPPDSTKASLQQRLKAHATTRWPQIHQVLIRHRAGFAYIDAELADGTTEKLLRLRYGGSASRWGFAIYLYSKNGYEDSFLPNGTPVGTPEEALDCAAGFYLNDPSAWLPPTN
jgi:hypothetical protein